MRRAGGAETSSGRILLGGGNWAANLLSSSPLLYHAMNREHYDDGEARAMQVMW